MQELSNFLSLVDKQSGEKTMSLLSTAFTEVNHVIQHRQVNKVISAKSHTAIKLAKELQRRILIEQLQQTDLIQDYSLVVQYSLLTIGSAKIEKVLLFLLNSQGYLQQVLLHASGTINYSTIYLREILATILNMCPMPKALIMVHNHPSDNVTPSKEDIAFTREATASLAKHGIRVINHLVITRYAYNACLST